MITLKHIDKKYHANRRNENHVLKDISLDFPKKGMVMLLGESGSGKTTLLNIIGGLDKAQKGRITINDSTLEKYDPKRWDLLRNRHIGYIFQNFYLMPHETVFDNIRISLKMIGLEDEHQIEKRINELLKLVGMPQYKHRKANQLSGGQQQRIAIARALSKDPDVIIADEPTGNLDSKNTMMIMNILKQIAKEKLIIMVTHETRLANHYGEQIIHIEDGRVKSKAGQTAQSPLDTTTESDIYLQDLTHHKHQTEASKIDFYTDQNTTEFNARLIIKNNTLYIDIQNGAYQNIHILKPNDDIYVHDAKRSEVAKETPKDTTFKLSELDIPEKRAQKSGIIPWRHSLERALSTLKQSSKFAKLLYLGFAFSAAMFAVAIALFSNIYFFSDADFLSEYKYSFEVTYETKPPLEDLESLAHDGPFDAYLPDMAPHSFNIYLPRFYHTQPSAVVDFKIAPLTLKGEQDLILGHWPTHPTDMIISKQAAEQIIENPRFKESGVNHKEDLLNLSYEHQGISYRITGIVQGDAPLFYATFDHIYTLKTISPYTAYSLLEGNHTIREGRTIEADYEFLIPYNETEAFESFEMDIDGQTFVAVGSYQTTLEEDPDWMLMHVEGLKSIQYHSQPTDREISYIFYSSSEQAAETYLSNQNHNYENLYQSERTQEVNQRVQSAGGLIIFTLVVMGLSALSYYFILRSSMMKRIYEIGVYRAIGVRRSDIMRIFLIEILTLTTFTSFLGYAFMRYILGYIHSATSGIADIFNLSWMVFIAGLIIIYAINTLFGLFPLYRILRKTPAEILTTYDL